MTTHTEDYQSMCQVCDEQPRTDRKNFMKCWERGKQI